MESPPVKILKLKFRAMMSELHFEGQLSEDFLDAIFEEASNKKEDLDDSGYPEWVL